LADSGCRDRALLVLGSNTAKQAAFTALLDPSTHFRPPLTHTSHHRPAFVYLSRFRVSPILTHSRFRRSSTCISAVSDVSLVGVFLLSADVAVAVVRPEVIYQRVLIPRSNKGPLQSSCQGAHDRTITPNAPKKIYMRVYGPLRSIKTFYDKVTI
jgi:hypothetical protein